MQAVFCRYPLLLTAGLIGFAARALPAQPATRPILEIPRAPAPLPAPRRAPNASPPKPFEFYDGDRVVFLGDTLVEQMRDYGYVETLLTSRFPNRNIIFRNLGWSADTPLGLSRAGFGPPADGFHRLEAEIAAVKPTVVFLGYGMASSFDGTAGLPKFVAEMNRLIDAIQSICTNKVRFVLLSPIRHETMPPPLPDPAAHNQQLAAYTRAIAQIAGQHGFLFVNLFDGFRQWDASSGAPPRRFTDDGIHPTAYGYWRLANAIARGLHWFAPNWWLGITRDGRVRPETFGTQVSQLQKQDGFVRFTKLNDLLVEASLPVSETNLAPYAYVPRDFPRCRLQFAGLPPGRYALKVDGRVTYIGTDRDWFRGPWIERGPEFDQAEALRQAIIRKNRLFFYRWRPQNITYLFGFRRQEQGKNAGEIPEFDPLVKATEDQIAQLRHPRPHTYELVPMTGTNANLTVQLTPKPPLVHSTVAEKPVPPQPLPHFEVAPGFQVSLFAESPELAKPIEMNFDPQGRLWVATSQVYPQIKPGQVADDKIIVLEDTNGDGRADKSTVFADGLLIPTGVEPGDGGAYVGQSTDLLFFKDTNGDGRADQERVVLSGFGTEDTHHLIHTLRWGYDGQLYFNQSIYIHSHLETPHGVVRLNSGGVYHLRPATMQLGVFLRGFCNPWGHQFDQYGQSFVTDGAGFEGISFGVPGAMYFTYAGARRELPSVSPGSYPKFCGLEIIYSRQFPDDWQGNMITCDFRAHRVVRFAIAEKGAGYVTTELPDLLRSTNVTFRPIDVKLGPDGALYVADWANPIIQHGEVDFRDPRRDHTHGRIWRITAKDRPLLPRPKLVDAPDTDLLNQLLSPNSYNRQQARRVLTERGPRILKHLAAWANAQTSERALLQALWMYESIDVVQAELLKRLLTANDPHIRDAATRVLGYWHNRVEDPLGLLAARVADENPRVRLEALRALGEIHTPRAVDLAFSALRRPLDPYLEYALWLTINDLAPTWIEAIQSGAWKPAGHEPELAYGLKAIEPALASTVLAKLIQGKPLPRDGSGPWIDLIGSAGDPHELRRLFDQTLAGGFEDAAAQRALTALADATRLRNLRPTGDLDGLGKLLAHPDPAIRQAACRLMGGWKLARFVPDLLRLAGDTASPAAMRETACDSLHRIGGPQATNGLRALTDKHHPLAIRERAVIALAALDPDQAMPAAIDVISATTDETEALAFWRALLRINGITKPLVRALPQGGLPKTAARTGLRAARETGRNDPDLILALGRGGNLSQTEQSLTPAEMRRLIARVKNEGNPARGEILFRSATLGCTTCHSIGGAGGKVGPDLTSIGASSPVDYLIESVLQPNKIIKEGYQSLLVTTKDGEDYSGILVRENDRELVLRNAANQEVSIPKHNLQTRAVGGSLMPTGLTDTLTPAERIDLFRFLSELGKPGPYDAAKADVARLWYVHSLTTSDDENGQNHLAAFDPRKTHWQTALTLVDGRLPKTELQRLTANSVTSGLVALYAATRFELPNASTADLKLTGGANAPAWIDGKPVNSTPDIQTQLPAGVHTFVVKLDPRQLPDALRLECDAATFLAN